MTMDLKLIITVLAMISVCATALKAGESGLKRYHVGGRSAIIIGEMGLADLDPVFGDLSTDGLSGAHHSGLFIQYTWKPYLRLGLETLVGNSAANKSTTMNFQAAGPVAEFIYQGPVSLSGGLHMGGMILNAMHRPGASAANKVESGVYFKGEGVFLAPFAGIGTRIKSLEVRLFTKYVLVSGENKVDSFSALYSGLSYSYGF